MFQIDNSTAATSLPAPAAAGTPGYFTDGNAALATPATIVPADWFNMVQQELLSILTAAGVTPVKTEQNQLSLILLGAETDSVYYQGTPVSGVVTTFTRTLTFTAPCNGKILAQQICNVGSGASTPTQPGNQTNSIVITGSTSGTSQNADKTAGTLCNAVTHSCVAGETVTVTGSVTSSGDTGAWSNNGMTTSYIFVPSL